MQMQSPKIDLDYASAPAGFLSRDDDASTASSIRIREQRQHHLWSVDLIASAAIDQGHLTWLSERTT
jgi:hypothetical protein